MRREGGERGHSARCAPFASADHSFGETGRLAAPFVATAARSVIDERTKFPFPAIHKRAKLQLAEGARRGAVAQHDERRCKTMRATRFRRRHRQKGKRPRNRCRTMVLHRALRQQGSESLASIRPAPSARSAAVAESEGFEPPEDLHPQRFSRPPRSTTPPTLHIVLVSSLLSLRSTRSETRQIFFSRFAPYAHGPLALRCAPLARRLVKFATSSSPGRGSLESSSRAPRSSP